MLMVTMVITTMSISRVTKPQVFHCGVILVPYAASQN